MSATIVPSWPLAPFCSGALEKPASIATATDSDSPTALLSPICLTSSSLATSSKASKAPHKLDFTPPRIESLSICRRSHRTRPKETTSHSFDDLPWISAMHCPPEVQTPWDIADLSQIPVSDMSPRPSPSTRSKLGPIRRTRTTSRPSPVQLENEHPNSTTRRVSSTRQLPKPPRTPRCSSTIPHVRFHNLMPIFSLDPHHDLRPSEKRAASLSLRPTTIQQFNPSTSPIPPMRHDL